MSSMGGGGMQGIHRTRRGDGERLQQRVLDEHAELWMRDLHRNELLFVQCPDNHTVCDCISSNTRATHTTSDYNIYIQ